MFATLTVLAWLVDIAEVSLLDAELVSRRSRPTVLDGYLHS